MSKCLGCGITLQNKEINALGYTKNPENKICERCFKLKNYGEYTKVNLTNKEYQQIIDQIPENSLVVYVSDILTLNLFQLSKFKKVLLVVTKRDILPKSVKDEKMINYLKKRNPNCLDILMVSSIKNYNLDSCYHTIKKYANQNPIYFVGNTNSGKSTLLNTLIKNYGENSTTSDITVSMYPSTTLDQVEIHLGELTFIDTPGLIEEGSITNILDTKELKKITPKKEIKPRSCQLKGKGSILIENYVRIDYETKKPNSLVIYTSNFIKTQFISLKNEVLKNGSKFEFHLEKKQDIVIPGLGFIKCVDPIEITIYTRDKVNPYTRDNLI